MFTTHHRTRLVPLIALVATAASTALAITLLGPVGASAGPADKAVEECQPGSIKAQAFVDAGASFSTGFTTDGVSKSYNCASASNSVLVRRTSAGSYEVRFPGISGVGTGPLIASVDVAQLIGGIATSADLNIASATRDDDGTRTLVVRCKDVDNESNTDLCDFTVTLASK